jgi:NAD(P)H dehydrogenase (quinone)
MERYTDRLSEYLQAGEIIGAAGNGKISAASRKDYAAAAAAAVLRDESGNRTYELGGPPCRRDQEPRRPDRPAGGSR